MAEIIWRAPAKLNLFLHLLGCRADGYHHLQSMIVLIDYCDQLTFSLRKDGQIVRQDRGNKLPTEDLTRIAAMKLQQYMSCKAGVTINLYKNIPIGAGLGGGSSDAATTLIALNQLWELHLPRVELQEIGLQIGADIPFFLGGTNAFVEGIGEILTPIQVAPIWYLVVIPPGPLSTKKVFTSLELTAWSKAITIDAIHDANNRNDLASTVMAMRPDIYNAKQWLDQKTATKARLSGSGSAIFLELDNLPNGKKILADLPEQYSGFLAKGLSNHPHAINSDAVISAI